MRTPCRPTQAAGCHVQKLQRVGLQQDVLVYGLTLKGHIAAALALYGAGAGCITARANALRRFSSRCVQQVGMGQAGHLHMQIDAVHQGAAELGLVAVNLVWRAAAAVCAGTQIATGAGIHGTYQLKPSRKFCPLRRP